MAEDTLGLNIPIGADPSPLREGLNEAGRQLNAFEQQMRGLENLGNVFTSLGQKLTLGVTVPLTALATGAIKAYGDIQALQLGLESMIGSVSVANREFEKLKEVAKLPGLGLQEAVKGSINLQAIGFSAGNARKVLLEFGNAVASVGKGRVEFDRAIYGLSQLANTPFPLGEDLNIIADALPQVRTLLQDAFGKTRSDDLRKMGVTSQQIVEVILNGLGKLPRVAGGVKNAFENLKDTTQQNLARIGKTIDTAFDISGTINKLTDLIDRLISRFENLSPGVQKAVLITTALAAATGPVLVGLGGIIALIPTLVNGFTTLTSVIRVLNSTMLTNPYVLIGAAIAALVAGLLIYRATLETGEDRQNRFSQSLAKATLEAKNEQSELAKLYQKTQDHSLAIEERRKAVDLLQKQYPGYFENIKDEIILAGKASETYNQLYQDILKASRARAAQSELDRRNAKRLEEDIDLQNKVTQSLNDYKNAQDRVISTENGDVFISGDKAREAAKGRNKALLEGYKQRLVDRQREDKLLLNEIKKGQDAINKIDQVGTNNLIPGISPEDKKKRERQIAEIIPEGSIADFRKRAELLQKSIDYSVDGLVKVRGLDKFGKDVDKKGNPYYTGLVLPIEQAYEELEKLQVAGGTLDLQPVKMNSRGVLDSLGNEFKTFGELLSAQNIAYQNTLNGMSKTIDAGAMKILEKTLKIKEATEELNKSLKDMFKKGLAESITDVFTSIGSAIASGQNVLQSLGLSLISAFGKILSDLGKQMITYGTSLLALKIAMKSLNPYVAIAAGVALVALGSAVTGAVRNQSNSIGGGGSTISSSAGVSSQSYSGNYTSGGGGGGNFTFRIEGRDLVTVLNREIAAGNRLNAG